MKNSLTSRKSFQPFTHSIDGEVKQIRISMNASRLAVGSLFPSTAKQNIYRNCVEAEKMFQTICRSFFTVVRIYRQMKSKNLFDNHISIFFHVRIQN